MHLSVSQVNMFKKSPAERAGTYLLGIKPLNQTYFLIGKLFHKYCEVGSVDHKEYVELLEKELPFFTKEDQEKILEQTKNLISKIVFDIGENVEGKKEFSIDLHRQDIDWKGYIDVLLEDHIIDYKTSYYLTKPEKVLEKYGFQAYIYMIATGKTSVSFYEVSKYDYKSGDNFKIHVVEMSKELENYVNTEYVPIIETMKEYLAKYDFLLNTKKDTIDDVLMDIDIDE